MKQINVETATREQLVDFIRRLHPQLLREQERIKELESQISGFQAFIQEKNAEIRELRHQSDRLTEKSASDEETISALIRQVEEVRSDLVASRSPKPFSPTAAPQRCRGAELANGKFYLPTDGTGNELASGALRAVEATGVGDTAGRPSRTTQPPKDNVDSQIGQLKAQNAAALSTIASKTEEIIALEAKTRDLTEVNAFYSAIVSQHDQEEKMRMGHALADRDGFADDDAVLLRQEVERLQHRLYTMDGYGEKLQQIMKGIECDKAALRRENETLKRELMLLEAQSAEVVREYALACEVLVGTAAASKASAASVHTFASASKATHPRAASAPPQRPLEGGPFHSSVSAAGAYSQLPDIQFSSQLPVPASSVSPLARDGRQSHVGGTETTASRAGSGSAASSSHSRFSFRSLRPLRVRHPDSHEKELLERIRVYEEQLAQMDIFEADRQRSFDEMERNRAELFVSMNAQLEKQRREIQRLRRMHEEASLNSSDTVRPSHDPSDASLANREEEGKGSWRQPGSQSPIEQCHTAAPTGSPSLRLGDSDVMLDCAVNVDVTASAEAENSTTRAHHHLPHMELPASLELQAEKNIGMEEKEARLFLWLETLEEKLEVVASMQSTMGSLYANALVLQETRASEAEGELEKKVQELQALTVELGTKRVKAEQVASSSDASFQAGIGEATPLSESTGWMEAELWNVKGLTTAVAALEAYGALAACNAPIHGAYPVTSANGSDRTRADGFLAAEIAADLKEVHAALETVRGLRTTLPLLDSTPRLPFEQLSSVGVSTTQQSQDWQERVHVSEAEAGGDGRCGGSTLEQEFSSSAPLARIDSHAAFAVSSADASDVDVVGLAEGVEDHQMGDETTTDCDIIPGALAYQFTPLCPDRSTLHEPTDDSTLRKWDAVEVLAAPDPGGAVDVATMQAAVQNGGRAELPPAVMAGTSFLASSTRSSNEEGWNHADGAASPGTVDEQEEAWTTCRAPPDHHTQSELSFEDENGAEIGETTENTRDIATDRHPELLIVQTCLAAPTGTEKDHQEGKEATDTEDELRNDELEEATEHEVSTLNSNAEVEVTEGEAAELLAQLEKEMMKELNGEAGATTPFKEEHSAIEVANTRQDEDLHFQGHLKHHLSASATSAEGFQLGESTSASLSSAVGEEQKCSEHGDKGGETFLPEDSVGVVVPLPETRATQRKVSSEVSSTPRNSRPASQATSSVHSDRVSLVSSATSLASHRTSPEALSVIPPHVRPPLAQRLPAAITDTPPSSSSSTALDSPFGSATGTAPATATIDPHFPSQPPGVYPATLSPSPLDANTPSTFLPLSSTVKPPPSPNEMLASHRHKSPVFSHVPLSLADGSYRPAQTLQASRSHDSDSFSSDDFEADFNPFT